MIERDFDSDSNFEERLIEDEERNDKRQYAAQILHLIEGLGSIEVVHAEGQELKTYVKGENSEAALKGLCLQCRKDIPDRPTARLYLAQYQIMKNDLLYLLTGYPQDRVLSYYVIILLESLTNPQQSGLRIAKVSDEMLLILQSYKQQFIKPLNLQTLLKHLWDCLQETDRSKTHNQMIELIVLLFKNLLSIPDGEDSQNLQKNLIHAFIKEGVLSAFIYLAQDFNSPTIQKLAISLNEIFFYIFTPFDVDWLIQSIEEDRKAHLTNMKKFDLLRKQNLVPARHSRFGGIFMTHRSDKTSGQINAQPFQTRQVNKLANQRQKPFLRSVIAKHKTIFMKQIILEDCDAELKEQLKEATIDFMQHAFSRLIECVYSELNKEITEVEDKIRYFVICAYFMKFTRLYCKKNMDNHVKPADTELSSEFVYVSAALQLTQFQFIYANLLHESTQLVKKNFNYRNYFAVMTVLYEFMMIVKDLSLSLQPTDRSNAQLLMKHIFTHDVSKAILIGFGYCQYGLFNDQLLITLIKFSALFYDLLESFSKGTQLLRKITNQKLKKKIKQQKKKKRQEQEGDEDQEEEHHSGSESEEEDDEPMYKERNYNLSSEFAVVVEYQVLQKYFYLIRDEKLLNNPQDLNISIYKYFKRVVDLLKADWIFFQVDFLYQINTIMHNKLINFRSEFAPLIQLFNRIVVSFIQLFKLNRMMSVEVLFRFPDVQTKDSILRNYSEIVALDEEHPQEHYAAALAKTVWTQLEDKALIDNYEKFKDAENPEEQLSFILNNLGYSMKTLDEIRKRIRKYRLNVSTDKAIQKYHERYEKISMKKEEIMTQSVAELLISIGEETLLKFLDDIYDQATEYIQVRNNEQVEMPLPPFTQEQFAHMDRQQIQAILLGLDFKPPGQGEIYWRIPMHMQTRSIQEMPRIIDKYILKAKSMKEDVVIEEEYRPLEVEVKQMTQRKQQQEEEENRRQQTYIADEEEDYIEQPPPQRIKKSKLQRVISSDEEADSDPYENIFD